MIGRRRDVEPLETQQQQPVDVKIVAADRDGAAGRQIEFAERARDFVDVPAELGIRDCAAMVDECHALGQLGGMARDMIAGGRAGW